MTNFRICQTERVCRRQCQIWWKWQKVLRIGRKHWAKRRNCSLRAISPFPMVFSKDLYCRHEKKQDLLGKGFNFSWRWKLKLRQFTLHPTIPTFNTPGKKKTFENIVGKGENAGNQHFLLFPTMFSTIHKINFNFWVTFILSSANPFNLDWYTILLFGKELKGQM